jgi:hypothetical protein
VHWSQALSGSFVGTAADCAGGQPVEATSLRELFSEVARRETAHQIKASQQKLIEDRAERLLQHQARISKGLGHDRKPPPKRGARRAVVLMYVCRRGIPSHTPIDRRSGKPKTFASVALAGDSIGRCGQRISESIERGSVCSDRAFAYIDSLPTGHPLYVARKTEQGRAGMLKAAEAAVSNVALLSGR